MAQKQKQNKPLQGLKYNWQDNMVSILCPYCLKKGEEVNVILGDEPNTCWLCHHTYELVQYVVEVKRE